MEHSRSVLKLETTTETEVQQNSVHYMCIRCGKQFTKPIFAVNNSPGVAEAYYACPACLSKVEIKKEEKKTEPEEEKTVEIQTEQEPEMEPETTASEPQEEQEVKAEAKPASDNPSTCAHHLGYLKNRPKNTPVPEECFTCIKMLDCMA
jgi:DNA-directed RNA polymerase subunit RPC12/RpoP